MIGSCLGLTAANCILMNQRDLRAIFDVMSSAANNSRLDDFGVDAIHLNNSLEKCIKVGFRDQQVQRKYSYQELIIKSNMSPSRVDQARRILAEINSTEEKGYIFNVDLQYEESYLLVWLLYTLNFDIWPKNILSQEVVDLAHSEMSLLIGLLSSIPSYSLTGQKLFGMEVYRLTRKNEEEFRRMMKASLLRHPTGKHKSNKLSYSSLKVRMSSVLGEIIRWEEMVRADGSTNHDVVEEEMDSLRKQMENLDSGELVLSLLQGDTLIRSYCKVFGKDEGEIKDLTRNMDFNRLLEVYEDLKGIVWGLHECNVDFYDDCRRSITITYGKYSSVDALRGFSGVVSEVKEAIDSASSLFEPIKRSVGA